MAVTWLDVRVMSMLAVCFAVGIGVIVLGERADKDAFERLSALSASYPYGQTCDADGRSLDAGPKNCAVLDEIVYVHGAVDRVFRKDRIGMEPEFLAFVPGKWPTSGVGDIRYVAHTMEKSANGGKL